MADRRSEPSVEQRLAALENFASELADTHERDERLVSGVERLTDETGALNRVLTQVDAQQRELQRIGKEASEAKKESSSANRSAEASAFAAEAARATASIERRMFLRRLYASAAAVITAVILAVIGGAWLTDAHLQNCLIDGPRGADETRFCNVSFPGHDHPEGESIEGLILQQTLQVRAGCERDNARVQASISQTNKVRALAGSPAVQAALDETIQDFEELLVDCDAAYPLPHKEVR